MLDLNLVPPNQRQASKSSKHKFTVAALVGALLAVAVPEVVLGSLIQQRETRITEQDAEMLIMRKTLKERTELLDKIKKDQEVLELAATLSKSKSYWTVDINQIITLLPSSAAIESAALKPLSESELRDRQSRGVYLGRNINREIALDGSVASADLDSMLMQFENDERYDIDVKNIDQESGRSTFNMTVGLTGPVEEAQTEEGAEGEGTAEAIKDRQETLKGQP